MPAVRAVEDGNATSVAIYCCRWTGDMPAAKGTVVNSAVIFWRESVCPLVIFTDIVARRPFVAKEE